MTVPDVMAMISWINARKGILDHIEYARHTSDGWTGLIYFIRPQA